MPHVLLLLVWLEFRPVGHVQFDVVCFAPVVHFFLGRVAPLLRLFPFAALFVVVVLVVRAPRVPGSSPFASLSVIGAGGAVVFRGAAERGARAAGEHNGDAGPCMFSNLCPGSLRDPASLQPRQMTDEAHLLHRCSTCPGRTPDRRGVFAPTIRHPGTQ